MKTEMLKNGKKLLKIKSTENNGNSFWKDMYSIIQEYVHSLGNEEKNNIQIEDLLYRLTNSKKYMSLKNLLLKQTGMNQEQIMSKIKDYAEEILKSSIDEDENEFYEAEMEESMIIDKILRKL